MSTFYPKEKNNRCNMHGNFYLPRIFTLFIFAPPRIASLIPRKQDFPTKIEYYYIDPPGTELQSTLNFDLNSLNSNKFHISQCGLLLQKYNALTFNNSRIIKF